MVPRLVSRWGELFDVATAVVDHVEGHLGRSIDWRFGGGTALMLQIDHRESHDVDLFVDDPQLLPFFNALTQGIALPIAPSNYETDGHTFLKLVFDEMGEIDVICCAAILDPASAPTTVRGRRVDLETPGEIVAKKVWYRGGRLQPRDMFDIAAVRHVMGIDHVRDVLRQIPDHTAEALKVARRWDPGLVRSVVADLLLEPKFAAIADRAQELTIETLASV